MTLEVPSGTPPGSYQVQIGFVDDGRRMPATDLHLIGRYQPIADLRLGPITIRSGAADPAASRQEDRAPVRLTEGRLGIRSGNWWDGEQPDDPRFPGGDGLEIPAGWVLRGQWHWLAQQGSLPDARVAFRLVDESGHIWAEHESPAVDGLYPTQYWRAGERVFDQQDLYLEPDLPPGRYIAEVTMMWPDQVSGEAVAPSRFPVGEVDILPPVKAPDASLYPEHRIDRRITDGLTLLNLQVDPSNVQPGDTLKVQTRWQATAAPLPDVEAIWELVDQRSGHVWAAAEGPLTGHPGYPTAEWAADTIVRGQHSLTLDRYLPAGSYSLRLRLVDARGQTVTNDQDITTVEIADQPRMTSAEFEHAIGQLFGSKMSLAGFDARSTIPVSTDPRGLLILRLPSGQPLDLRLYWRAEEPAGVSYTVFVQLLDQSGRLVAQHDGLPQHGVRPTTDWQPGEY
ncbi:MAG TPA: hypothetical protein VGR08_04425, partial [Thermomicrobiales bacterium]|nr:hypothetical protein [Thermomicrobiales bacterium]